MDTVAAQYEAFTTLAKKLCAAIEDPTITGTDGLRTIHDLLLPVHAAAMKLPQVESGSHSKGSITYDEWAVIFQNLKQRLPVDRYWDSFDPIAERENQPIQHSLVDDLADIWRELKNGLLELETEGGHPPEDVWWEWHFSFQHHWGHHSAGALRVMYFALRDIS